MKTKAYIASIAAATAIVSTGFAVPGVVSHTTAHAQAACQTNVITPDAADGNYQICIPSAGLLEILNRSLSPDRDIHQPITKAEALTLANVVSPQHRQYVTIDTLEGLQFFTNISYLELRDYGIASPELSKLEGLTKLAVLDLSGNSLTDVSSLAKLTGLMSLSVERNGIVDVTPLKALVNLRGLSIANNSTMIWTNKDMVENPLRDINGNVVPVVETDKVQNVDKDGAPDVQGGFIKLLNVTTDQNIEISWDTAVANGRLRRGVFSGTMIIVYNVKPADVASPDTTPGANADQPQPVAPDTSTSPVAPVEQPMSVVEAQNNTVKQPQSVKTANMTLADTGVSMTGMAVIGASLIIAGMHLLRRKL